MKFEAFDDRGVPFFGENVVPKSSEIRPVYFCMILVAYDHSAMGFFIRYDRSSFGVLQISFLGETES